MGQDLSGPMIYLLRRGIKSLPPAWRMSYTQRCTMTRGSLNASSLNRTSSFSSPSYFPFYGGATDISWLPNKVLSKTKNACCFGVEVILSVGPSREAAAQQAMHIQQPGGGARNHPAAMLTWAHLGDTNSLHPVYYQQLSGYNQGQPGCLSRGTFVQRSGRRIRTIYTDDQLTKLEEVFSKQRYMTGTEKMLLASALRLTETQVKVWFQNRRTRWRKAHGDMADVPEKHAHNETSSREEDELISVDNDESWVYF
ncbi:hypothetical protein J4Q44_G00310480 [Coregonus suidteri]|uniref:Homeobox domain-containing protein n=1 Tax=Coregonus suidteri TaxID=861788 RepID=A0AAN8QID0_9TELE